MGKVLHGNKKIANATPTKVGKLQFKSRTEAMVYRTLRENGFKPKYEPETFVIWKGYYPREICYIRGSGGKLVLSKDKIRNITYTPDFIFRYKGYKIILEVKGFETDTFKNKFKMFRKMMDKKKNVLIFEVFTKRMVMQMISLLDELEDKSRRRLSPIRLKLKNKITDNND
jgi:hypothetical protein